MPLQLLTVIVLIVATVLYFLWHQGNFQRHSGNRDLLDATANEQISVPGSATAPPSLSEAPAAGQQRNTIASATSAGQTRPGSSSIVQDLQDIDDQPAPPEPAVSASSSAASRVEQAGQRPSAAKQDQEVNASSAGPDDTPLGLTCSQSATTIKDFYDHLDNRAYIQEFDVSPNSEVYFTALIQRLLDNPPVVSGETDDLYTLLQNTAHFFRIIGKKNILLLKAILDMEKDQFEKVLREFYTLIHIPSCSRKSFGLRVPEEALYNYAGFFLNTMGGRLYLFRRDSMSRMVVSYYSILLIDRANKNASNRHGIELAAAIDQLIEEMESTTNTLRLKDMYLDRLYALKEQYQ